MKNQDICDECKINIAQAYSYAIFHKKLCLDCYKELLEKEDAQNNKNK
jgi:hypothetical protein